MEEKILPVLKKRFNNESKVLNLDTFYKDPGNKQDSYVIKIMS